MAARKKILFIMNPISGNARKTGIPKIIETRLDKESFEFEIEQTHYAGHACELAAKARENGYDAVVAVGGDGTVNEVAKALTYSDTALGIIPCGSGNGLARHLMIPMDAVKAMEVINNFIIHDLDYGVINNIPFFCTCGMGFDAFISMKFAESGRRGPVTYIENILREGVKYKPETYEIKDGNGSSLCRAFLISCANASQYGNNAYIAPQASMSDGLLDVIIMEPFDILDATQISIDMFNKTLDKNPRIKTFKTKHIQIHREKPGFIHYDGEPVMTDSDVDISIKDKGIKIIINPSADKTRRMPTVMQNAFSVFFNDIVNAITDKKLMQSLNNVKGKLANLK